MANEDQVFPAIVYVQDGSLQVPVEGFYNSLVVGCRLDGVDLAWPIALQGGDAVHELHGRRPKRVFHVNKQFPEFAIPREQLDAALIEWRNRTLRDATGPDGSPDVALIQQRVQAFNPSAAQALVLAKVFASSPRPETTGSLVKHRFADGLRASAQESWLVTLFVGLVFFIQGWQMADTALPDIGKSVWFTLMMPFLLLGAIFFLARKGA